MMTTGDTGQSWHIQRLPQVDWVRTSSFLSDTLGWAIGHWYDITNSEGTSSKIFKTDDGGVTWQQLYLSINVDFSVYSLDEIEFAKNHTGFVLANPSSTNPDNRHHTLV